VAHIYSIAGVYTATVTASNAAGVVTATTTVTILEAPTPWYKIYLPIILK
jgi:PKD repeat protein